MSEQPASLQPRPAAGQPQPLRRWVIDAVVAVAVAAVQVGVTYSWHAQHHEVPGGGLALLAAGGLALVWRHRFPLTTLAVTFGTTFAYEATASHGGAIWLASIVAFCTAIYLGKRAAALAYLIACYLGFLCGPLLAGKPAPPAVFALGVGAGLIVMVAAAELLRLRGLRATALAQRREEEVLRRASEERLRMARDLHDVVAHNISVINVQASTALHLMDRQPERAMAALSVIHDVSKQALVELRSVLGILRDVDAGAPRAPSSSLARLDDLLAGARASGLNVRLEGTAQPPAAGPLPASVDLAAYRILQEALTNSARHGARGNGETHTVVRISRTGTSLVLEVDDDGPALAGAKVNGSGNGIIGMAERASALGGTLEAGPRPAGGFRVRACLPVGEESEDG
ncbi:MAG TPA: histidine kinase [Streptosporangiaceae bacterium]|jgi:signal transduction histidine kinase